MASRMAYSATRAGLAYCVIVFTVGFALGTLRVLVLLPSTGETVAVLLELPVILAVSWYACRWIMDRFGVPETAVAGSIMGGVAFILLMAAELLLGTMGFGRTVSEHIARYGRLPEQLGLAGQLLFAAFPYIQASRKPHLTE